MARVRSVNSKFKIIPSHKLGEGPRSGGEVCFSSANNRRWLMVSTPYFANFLLQTGSNYKKIEENFEKF